MAISEFAFRLLVLFFPGIVCFLIVDTLTVHKERKPHEVFLLSFVYGAVAYSLWGFGLWLANCVEDHLNCDFPESVAIIGSISNVKDRVNFAEVFATSAIAFLLGVGISKAKSEKLLHDYAQKWKISKKFGDANVWSHAFNANQVTWATVRDIENNQMFAGYVIAFSDVEDETEILLSHVIVYNEKTGEKLYEADRMYLSRPKDCLTVELPNPPEMVAAAEPPPATITGQPPKIKNAKAAAKPSAKKPNNKRKGK